MKKLAYLIIGLIICSVADVNAQVKQKVRPYTVLEKGRYINKLNIIKDSRRKINTVQIEAIILSGGIARLAGDDMPGAEISEVVAFAGSFNALRKVSKSGRGETIQLTQVEFPLKLRMNISGEVLEVELKEEGYWTISVAINR